MENVVLAGGVRTPIGAFQGAFADVPAVDLGVVSAMASSFLDRPVDPGTIILGEVGLTGEVRAVSQMDVRIRESVRLGFNRCIVPASNLSSLSKKAKIEIHPIRSLKDLLENLF